MFTCQGPEDHEDDYRSQLDDFQDLIDDEISGGDDSGSDDNGQDE